MTRPLVLVTAPGLVEQAQDILRDGGTDLAYMPYPITEDSLVSHLSSRPFDAVLMRGSVPFTRRVIGAPANVKIIARHGVGFDTVDLAAATERGIAVMVPKGANADAVAEHSLALMLSLARELPRFDRDLRHGKWKDPQALGKGFRGRVVGILGYGEIGRKTAELASACGARVVAHTRSRIDNLPAGIEHEPDFDRFLSRVDILSLHCPTTDKTRGLIGAKAIATMKDGAIIVNTARGAIVDEAALVAALKSGKLAGAGVDVYGVEPPDPNHPLFSLPNVICTPHVAAATEDSMNRCGTIAAHNIVSYLRGELYDRRNLVNPEVFRPGVTAASAKA